MEIFNILTIVKIQFKLIKSKPILICNMCYPFQQELWETETTKTGEESDPHL